MTFGIGTSQQASAGDPMLMKKKRSLLKLQQVNTDAVTLIQFLLLMLPVLNNIYYLPEPHSARWPSCGT